MSARTGPPSLPSTSAAPVSPAPAPSPPRRDPPRRPAGPSPIEKLRGHVPLSAPPPMYNVATAFSAVVLVLLPVIYVGLVSLVGWLTFTHLYYNIDLLNGRQANVLTIAIYLLPSFLGIVLFVFMIKPLFHWGKESDVVATLTPEQEPLLFAYVNRLCDMLAAPKPQQIDVDLRVNASAGLGSLLNPFGDKLTLTLGLPLINGLNLTQFTGVLAHELGHFTQSKSLRLANWIRAINIWFIRVVHERDMFDERLDRWAQHGSVVQWLFQIARFFIWVTRRVLHMLMMLGHFASCMVARQAEYDADQFQAHTAGSQSFSSTMHKVHMMDLAHGATLEALDAMWREKRLGDNLPDLVVAKAREFPKAQIQPLIRLLMASKTKWHDTHPSFKDRLHHTRELNAPGIICDTRPARELFGDFAGLCRGQTVELYRQRLGKDFSEQNLVPTDQVVREWTATSQSFKSLRRFYQDAVLMIRPQFPDTSAKRQPGEPADVLKEVISARESIVALSVAASATIKKYDETAADLLRARQAQVFANLNVGFDAAAFKVDEASIRGVAKTITRLMADQKEQDQLLEEFDRVANLRLTGALQLLQMDRVTSRLADGAGLRARAMTLLVVCDRLCGSMEDVHKLRQSMANMVELLPNIELGKTVPRYIERVLGEAHDMVATMSAVTGRFAATAYPFEHFGPPLTIGQFLQEKAPDPEMVGDVTAAAADLLDRFESVLARTLAQVAATAEQVETGLSLPPLHDPPETDDLNKAVEEMEKAEREAGGMKAALVSAWNGAVQIGTSLAMLAVVVAAVFGAGWLAKAAPELAKERKEQRYQQYNPPTYRPPQFPTPGVNPPGYQPFNPNDPAKKNQPWQPNKPQPSQPKYPQPTQPTYPRPSNPRPGPSQPSRPSNPGVPRPSTPSAPRPGR